MRDTALAIVDKRLRRRLRSGSRKWRSTALQSLASAPARYISTPITSATTMPMRILVAMLRSFSATFGDTPARVVLGLVAQVSRRVICAG
jgi:hypothetical protein